LKEAVVLLIDHDQSQPWQRHEHRQPGTEQDITIGCGEPVFCAILFAQAAVQGGEAVSGKAAAKMLLELRRQGDFRNQHQRLLPLRQDSVDQAQIQFGLAAAGHPVQQVHAEMAQLRDKCIERGLLFGRQRRRVAGCQNCGRDVRVALPAGPARFDQNPRRADKAELAEGVAIQAALFTQPFQQLALCHCTRRRYRGATGFAQAQPRCSGTERPGIAQPWRQGGEQHGPQRMVVIIGAKLRELEYFGRQRGPVVQQPSDFAQFFRCDLGGVADRQGYPHLAGAAERHFDQGSRRDVRHGFGKAVIE
jgi:hypothetical protein